MKSVLNWWGVMLAGAALVTAGEPPASGGATTPPPGMAEVPGGLHRPLFRAERAPKEIPVKTFFLDATPVTNGDFLEFVRANPRWRRSQVKRLFADEGYLRHWAADLGLGDDAANEARRPVTHVSWFAAKAYAAWQGKRLPTTDEWELAAAAGFAERDATKDAEYQRLVNRWYSTPAPQSLPAVASGRANHLGIHDLHGLVWEWTSDFNSALVSGDARGDTGLDRQLYCGSGSLDSSDPANYPAFMRFGLRGSLKADYAVHNLGFRCARDL